MLFNSYEFIFFFLPVTLLGYFLIAKKSVKLSNVWLTLASFFFYGWWNIRFVPILSASILWNFIFGHLIHKSKNKKLVLFIAIAVNIALLGYFKYTDFFIDSINRFAHTDWNLLNIVLPLGISFWTFTQTAYLVDVYRGKTEPCNFLDYVLFVMIFPHLISGPIINHSEMIPQFNEKERHKFNLDNFTLGLMFFLFGLFKKVVIADSLAPIVDQYFGGADALSVWGAWIGVFAYTFQLYFDFSGYSEMALGLGKMINIDFPINFDSPYKSKSPIEFWQRWHMTLGSWIRDYLYIPLGGNRKGQVRKMLNLFIAMTLSGFWHGAGLKYIVWGIWHGFLLVVNHSWRYFAKPRNIKIPSFVAKFMTFAAITAGWVIFRGGVKRGLKIMTKMFNIESIFTASVSGNQIFTILILILLSVTVFIMPNVIEVLNGRFKTSKRWILVAVLLTDICILCISRNSVFLYFDF